MHKRIRRITIHKRILRKVRNELVYYLLKILPNKKMVDEEIDDEPTIIIALTSYPARFATLYAAIKSIMYQTKRPNRVILYLDENVTENQIPKPLLRLKSFGLEIEKRPHYIKCHKKYFHAITENPDAIVITIDDDSMYYCNTIKLLYKAYKLHPDCVCAKRVHRMTFDVEGKLLPYNQWDHLATSVTEPSDMLMATGVGCVLYPPHSLPDETFNVDQIERLSLGADDVWLMFMERLKGTRVLWVKNHHMEPYQIPSTQSTGLYLQNVDNSENDVFIKNVITEYNFEMRQA